MGDQRNCENTAHWFIWGAKRIIIRSPLVHMGGQQGSHVGLAKLFFPRVKNLAREIRVVFFGWVN